MHVAFVNPQGNFDPGNSYLASHPDFGGQLVYVREVARTLEEMGHKVDILTRRIVDPDWPEFSAETDSYPGHPNLSIVRVPCGPRHLPAPRRSSGPTSASGSRNSRVVRGSWPGLWTGHYADGGLCAALLEEASGRPSRSTATRSGLGSSTSCSRARKTSPRPTPATTFGARIQAERTALARSAAIVTNSAAERREQYGPPRLPGSRRPRKRRPLRRDPARREPGDLRPRGPEARGGRGAGQDPSRPREGHRPRQTDLPAS
jgi:sucrose-phosphate synthase